MPLPSPSTASRRSAYPPSVPAHRKPAKKPDALRPVLIRDLTSAEVVAIDRALDAINVAQRATGDRKSRSSMLAAWIRERLAAESAKGGER
jgi:hypothetical protein